MVEHNMETLQDEKHICKKTGGNFLDEEDRSIEDGKSFEEDSGEEEETKGDGHNTHTQRKLGLDISMIGLEKKHWKNQESDQRNVLSKK